MKNDLIGLTVVLCAASLTASAEEFSWGSVTFQPRAYAGYADYSLKSGDFDATYIDSNGDIMEGYSGRRTLALDLFQHDKITINGLIWGIGGTVASGQFFSDFYYQSTLNDTVHSSDNVQGDNGGIPYDLYLGSVDAQHSDWAISLGYMINSQWSVFAGYKSGSTGWNQYLQYNVRSVENTSLISNGTLGASFDQDGPFLGASFSYPIAPGILTLKAAYAYLDGTYKWNYIQHIYAPYSGSNGQIDAVQKVDLDGNSNAFSLGMAWTQLLADNLGLSIGVNYHKYNFNMSGQSSIVEANVPYAKGDINSGSMTEELLTLTASLFYQF